MTIVTWKERLLRIKSRLPANGDWIFVTENLPRETPTTDAKRTVRDSGSSDVANGATSQSVDVASVRVKLYSNDLDTIKLVYERAKAYESTIASITNRAYEKAKSLVSSASFVSAVLFGVVSLLLSGLPRMWWVVVFIEILLFLLLAAHLFRALSIGLLAITGEEIYYARQEEFLGAASVQQDGTVNAYKDAISQIVSYADRTHEKAWHRVNRLLLAQASFRYGIVFFLVFVTFHLVALAMFARAPEKDLNTRIVELEEKTLPSIVSRHEQLMSTLSSELSQAHRDNAALVEQFKEIQKRLAGVESKRGAEK